MTVKLLTAFLALSASAAQAARVDQAWGGIPLSVPQEPFVSRENLKSGFLHAEANLPSATKVGDVLLSPAPLNGPQRITVSKASDETDTVYYLALSSDGQTPAVFHAGDFAPVLSESELPGGKKLISQGQANFGVSGGNIFFTAFDPNATFNNRPVITVFTKAVGGQAGGLTTLLDRGNTRFPSLDPRSGQVVQFTYVQTAGFEVNRAGAVTVFVVATPPRDPAVPADPIPQILIVQRQRDGSWGTLFNNQVDAKTTQFLGITSFTVTGSGVLYLTGQAVTPPRRCSPSRECFASSAAGASR